MNFLYFSPCGAIGKTGGAIVAEGVSEGVLSLVSPSSRSIWEACSEVDASMFAFFADSSSLSLVGGEGRIFRLPLVPLSERGEREARSGSLLLVHVFSDPDGVWSSGSLWRVSA